MKTLLALCLLLAITSIHCEFDPEWTACDPSLGWRTFKVVLDAPPVAGQNSTFTLCGQNYGLKELRPRNIVVSDGYHLNQTFDENGVVIALEDNYCFDMNVTIPQGHNELQVKINLSTWIVPVMGCAVVKLDLGANMFLGYPF